METVTVRKRFLTVCANIATPTLNDVLKTRLVPRPKQWILLDLSLRWGGKQGTSALLFLGYAFTIEADNVTLARKQRQYSDSREGGLRQGPGAAIARICMKDLY